MYNIQNNTIIPSQCKDIICMGVVVDHRIIALERVVATHFGVSVYELDVSYRDTDAKLMCCFLLHDLLHYSVGSLGARYKVYHGFLRTQINAYYIKCLQHADFMQQVIALRAACLEGNY